MQEKFLFFDKTQWERTRFADEANAKLVSKELLEKVNLLKTQEFDQDGKETQLIGEARQSMAVRGEYLNEIPKTIIILLVVELGNEYAPKKNSPSTDATGKRLRASAEQCNEGQTSVTEEQLRHTKAGDVRDGRCSQRAQQLRRR
ncbi:hypothetical protein Q1695_006434 [Nippostrongylus brasiliensis]|nr:hypothetical protein Q1695_006434 [Nippostrongylus brasiliensis]